MLALPARLSPAAQQMQQTISCSENEIYQELNMRVFLPVDLSAPILNLRVWQESVSLLWTPKRDICPVISCKNIAEGDIAVFLSGLFSLEMRDVREIFQISASKPIVSEQWRHRFHTCPCWPPLLSKSASKTPPPPHRQRYQWLMRRISAPHWLQSWTDSLLTFESRISEAAAEERETSPGTGV